MRTSRRAVLNQVNHESGDLFSYTGEYIDYGDGGRYRLVLLVSDGTFTAHRNFTADILVVAGGGAGGHGSAYDELIAMQGGTGGGCVAKYSVGSPVSIGTYSCVVGAGGIAKDPAIRLDINPVPGGDTSFGSFTTYGTTPYPTTVLGGTGYISSTSTAATTGKIIQVGNYVGHMFGRMGYPEYCSSGGGGNSRYSSGMAGGATGGGTGGGNGVAATAGSTYGSGGGGGGVYTINQRRKGGDGYQGVIALNIYTGAALST